MSTGKKLIIDRLREYILNSNRSGSLKAGGKLPSYSSLCKKFDVSYASIQYSFKELENDGVIERIQGVGTFLKGSEPLDIDLYIDTNAFPLEKTQDLLRSASDAEGLHLNIRVRNLCDIHKLINIPAGKKAVIVQDTIEPHINLGALLDLSTFGDYKHVMGQLKRFNAVGNYNLALPFYYFSYQLAYNPQIINKLNLTKKITGSNFDWWNEYVNEANSQSIIPAAKGWRPVALTGFSSLAQLILVLIIKERGMSDKLLSTPLFNTPSGHHILKIIKDHKIYLSNITKKEEFYNGGVGLDLMTGSWLSVQYKKKFNMKEDEIKIVPYTFGDRKICRITLQYLKPFVSPNIKPDEKERIWKLLKICISRDFQLKLCGMSGMLSVRKDIKANEHSWNTRPDFSAFIPNDDDIVINENIFNDKLKTAISTLYEQYEFHDASAERILKSMDDKLNAMLSHA